MDDLRIAMLIILQSNYYQIVAAAWTRSGIAGCKMVEAVTRHAPTTAASTGDRYGKTAVVDIVSPRIGPEMQKAHQPKLMGFS
ncbi:hypothetical protein [Massilia brevitalea]|uniref:hypothetical protein n=1 Tax=Massilia brevitalea TaxID=442526 RepID=UPI002739D652|nr:hypothetical protein [Massilia brevitalea]